jgi:hypothetical protein
MYALTISSSPPHLQKEKAGIGGAFGDAVHGDDNEPLSVTAVFVQLLSAPLVFIFKYSVPDCGSPKWQEW